MATRCRGPPEISQVPPVDGAFETHPCRQLRPPLGPLPAVHPGVPQCQADAAAYGMPREQPRRLEHHAGRLARPRLGTGHPHRAVRGLLESGDQPQQRALAAAGGTDQDQELAGGDGQVDRPDGGDGLSAPAVLVGDVVEAHGSGTRAVRPAVLDCRTRGFT
ncbi:hypothetical protein GCM10010300_24460 [Streptomyces olivaceoviridis]|nr:hypothetical protein GCM10010300_24460 [Streptomyces olivaceoviridis]